MEDGAPCTRVTVHDTFPFASRRARYLVTTTPQRVTRARFGDDAALINRLAARGSDPLSGHNRRAGKGRVLFLVDLGGPGVPLAALGFHVPDNDSEPPLIVCVAGLRDASGALEERTYAGLFVLKAYAHVVSSGLGQRGLLDADEGQLNARELERLGFQPVRGRPGRVRQEPYLDLT